MYVCAVCILICGMYVCAVFMYVCTVCMYVCLYVCMYICMYEEEYGLKSIIIMRAFALYPKAILLIVMAIQ